MALVDDVITITGTTEAKARIYLDHSLNIIMNTLYPFGYDDTVTMPKKYESLQVRIACFLVNKEGAEGETTHNEGGVSRGYDGSGVPKSLLNEITPMVKAL
jgi:hypothetical protein